MATRSKVIVVAGDVTVDWLVYRVPARNGHSGPEENWRTYPGTRMVARPGGALLLARMTQAAAKGAGVRTHRIDRIEDIPPADMIHSVVHLKPFPYITGGGGKNVVLRVETLGGFAGPETGQPKRTTVHKDDPNASLIVLDDSGNGFRDAQAVWPAALTNKAKKPWIVYKMHYPLAQGKLCDTVASAHADRTVLVVSAEDLRRSGAQISKRLSWERTVADCVWQLANNRELAKLLGWPHLIVHFDLDGAIYFRRDGEDTNATFFYDAQGIETGFRDGCSGQMIGLGCAFVSALTARLAAHGIDGVPDGIAEGIASARRLLLLGFGPVGDGVPAVDYPVRQIFDSGIDAGPPVNRIALNKSGPAQYADPDRWCILHDLNESKGIYLEGMARNVVVRGYSELQGVPVGRFGALRTVDRMEIESYRSIENLIRVYLDRPNVKRPLSIAVFGPPGSGKSFGVRSVARYVDKERVEDMEFNVSQFRGPQDLAKAFHLVRDKVLRGKVPLVFFDEFDCRFEGDVLGWLKYFLGPMQDGTFREGESEHPLGKVIFVFAGGTARTYEEFCCVPQHQGSRHAGGADGPAKGPPAPEYGREKGACDIDAFRKAKGPDFSSRLRGYVNVVGPNPSPDREPADALYPIRRAMLLRSLFERETADLIDHDGMARIDPSVLQALISVPMYRHGARSVEAIFEMSNLKGKNQFDQTALPPAEQLRLHVDADVFQRLVLRDVVFRSAREALAKAFHDRFRSMMKGKRSESDPSMQPWERLDNALKNSNRELADSIPGKLESVGYGFTPAKGPRAITSFPKDIEERLARQEHERFVEERLRQGWKLGPDDNANRTNLTLVPWDELPENEREKDRRFVRAIPELMAKVGFDVYALDETQ